MVTHYIKIRYKEKRRYKVNMNNISSCKVSIIMPSLNVVDYIDECIQSALDQTLRDIEIMCIDAGSTDGTWEKLTDYADHNDKVTLIHSDVRSYGYQVNLGINKAHGEYIAVLETDDFVEKDMYEVLYNLGVSNDLDIVKADYDSFVSYPEGWREFRRIQLWGDDRTKYNCVIDPRMDSYLYANDYNIWKGIYRRQFLLDNEIILNESKGAAFQDIGFAQQILACCKRMYYSDRSFYRYRMDREMSSINSVHGLEYSCQEFRRLLEDEKLKEKLVCKAGLYRHMAQSFVGELVKTLRAVDYNTRSEHIKPYYDWFCPKLREAIADEVLTEDMYYFDLPLVLNDVAEFSKKLHSTDAEQRKREELILSKAMGEETVIFGAGIRGKATCELLLRNRIVIKAICDNNMSIWGTELYGKPVCSPKECAQRFKTGKYIVANKFHKDEIKRQLMELGIEEKNIVLD